MLANNLSHPHMHGTPFCPWHASFSQVFLMACTAKEESGNLDTGTNTPKMA